ncbi:hypothetical protein Patl1_02811 [Pistacia atlantica]|uniref:Uncharacterized protein n=1 Tax=Pistacia atlantica TaxID=434234 RepID=A0ACC1C7S4_9ROSI|nr:hypothetical protein Patl1_02811 [Pistacia atlantica]
MALAMVLRRKPDALISVLPRLRESQKYQGQDKLSIIVWMITQVSEKQLCISITKGYTWKTNYVTVWLPDSLTPPFTSPDSPQQDPYHP